ncbi:hypothetical protein PIB30_090885 [Stylosanthes scabra]|uniref:Cucumopine synthase C-terminal helical bundle domain-containing protein n=1 Tax=Stylosanthes scabra TaxID=79078 RepID=A0ABU6QVE2_9FABA|nr:hypothetical protein [Stylosanthes scabra]
MPTSFSSLPQLVTAVKAATNGTLTTEPKEIKRIRTGGLPVGTNNQYFTTWDFVNGMIRDHSTCTWYSLLITFEDHRFSLDQCCALVHRFDYTYTNFLRYSGFEEMAALAAAMSKHLPTATTREEAVKAVRAFLAYLNRLAAWSFHYFPWDIGKHLTYYTTASVAASPDLSRRVHVTNGRKVRMTWQPLGISVVATLATKENPELCNDVLRELPFTIIQDHAVVSGESMYAWAPVISTAPVHVKERQCDAPVGRIRYSQATGNKIIVQYGEVTEDIETPVLGEIMPEYEDKLREVGRAVWKSTFQTKEIILLTMETMD